MPAANEGAFQQASHFLAGLTNRERLAPDHAQVKDLGPMFELLRAIDHPASDLALLQVGGTKGKGTTALLIEKLAEALSITTGSFLSPHLHRITERIRHRGAELDLETFGRCVLEVEPGARGMALPPSWFEVVTAAALVHFARVRPELVILEVGMGGRLDSTSAVEHRASVITGIGLEHMAVLGNTIGEIAREKAGLMRAGKTCVTGAEGEALSVLEEEARRRATPLLRLAREVLLEDVRTTAAGFRVRLVTPRGGGRTIEVGLQARVHLDSLALAVAALEEVFPEAAPRMDAGFLSETLAKVPLEGRFERLRPRGPLGPEVLLDSAHTAESIAALFSDISVRFPRTKVHLVFGCASDKRWREGLSAVAQYVDNACVAPIASPRSEDPKAIAMHLRKLGVPVSVHAGGTGAFQAAEELAGTEGLVLVTGSVYLVGEVRTEILSRWTTSPP